MKGLKPFLLMLAIALSVTSWSQQDPGSYKVVNGDTLLTDYPVKWLRKTVTLAEEGKEYKLQVDSLNSQLKYFELQLSLTEDKYSLAAKALEDNISNLKGQIALSMETIASLNKQIRRMKRKQFFTGAAGLLSTAAMIFIATK